ncbi:general odorant-binding protein 45-like [Wyeomyia smithii]|uniref:general odorant-binding protein 45-like n=1 Tax=Wyeomyia smithii TaxID=174621 RepID=UPI002467C5F7|nr:general odorant-binding protein 45-like [Wyeomyia smithii]
MARYQKWCFLFAVILVLAVPSSRGNRIVNDDLLKAQATCSQYLGISESRVAQYNISIYPSDRDTMCMIRCVGILLGFWDDEKGLLIDNSREFFPNSGDVAKFSQKALQCVERKLASYDPSDACTRAYFSFRCGMHQSEPCSTPAPIEKLTAEQFIRAQVTCARILRIPPDHLKLYKQGIYPDDAETRCLFRCFGIRTDLYSDSEGPNLERLHAQFAEDQPIEEFKARARQCMEANRPMINDKCTDAYRNLYLCFKEHFNAFTLRNRQVLINTATAMPTLPAGLVEQREAPTELLLYSDDD